MKKIILLAVMAVVASGACFAQQPPAPIPVQKANPVVIQKAVDGVVDSVVVADPTKNVPAQIVILGQDKKTMAFQIAASAMVYDVEMKMTTLDKLVKGDKVEIKYLMLPSGKLEARSIKIVK